MNQNIIGNELPLYKSFYKNYPDAILVLQDGVIIEYNELAQILFQVEEKELINKTLFDFTLKNSPNEDKISELENHLNTCVLAGKDIFEWKFVNKKGEKIDVKIFLSKIEVDKKIFIQAVLRDITEYKKIEQDLKKNIEETETEKNIFKLVIDNLPQGIFWKDLDCAYLGANKLLAQIGGVKDTKELIGKNDFDMPWTKEESIAYQEDDKYVMQNDRPKINIIEAQTNVHGEKTWLKTSKIPLKNKKGDVFGLVGIFEDITAQKVMEQNNDLLLQKLKEQNRKMIAITDVLDKSAIVSMTDKEGKIIKVNEDFCQISQYSEEELLGKDHRIVNSTHHPKEFWQSMWRDISRGKTWRADVKNKAKDGSYYWVDTVINSVVDSEGKIEGYLSIRYLITDRKNQELEIQVNQEQLQTTEEELRQNLEELEAQRDYIQEVNNEIKEKSDITDRNSQALLELNKSSDIYSGNLDVAFEVITKKTAKILNIERVSIWKYDTNDEAKIISQKQCETTKEGFVFTQGVEIKQKDTPTYFADLVAEKSIIADFAQNHPALVEFVDTYLIPLEINSVLDIPYFVDGKLAGVICCETQRQYKNWTIEDISFIKGIADIITIATKTQQQLEEQEKVKQNEKLLFRFLDRIPVGVAIIDKQGSPFFTNDIAKKLLGDAGDIGEGENIATVYPAKIAGTDEDYPLEKLPLIRALQGEEIRTDDMEIVKDSKRIPLQANASPIRTDNGDIEYAISIFQDISERKEKEREIQNKNQELVTTEEELRQNLEELQTTQEVLLTTQLEQEKLVSIITNVDALVAIADMSGKIEFLNEKGKVLSGFYENYQGRTISEFHNEEGKKQAQTVIIPTVMQQGEWKGEHQIQNYVTKENIDTLANVFVIRDPNTKKPISLGTVQIDITAQKDLEKSIQDQNQRLQASEEELRQNMEELQATQEVLLTTQLEQEKLVSVITNVDGLVAIADMSGKIEFLNEKGKVLSGFHENYQGRTISEFHNEEGKKQAQTVIIPTVMQQGEWKGEHQIQNYVTKENIDTLANVFVIRDPNTKKPISLGTVQIDITAQKDLEKSIQDQNQRLQASEEELRQNMEELQATQEAMREKQILIEEAKLSLERQNNKLSSNEAVLKKTFHKMKVQEKELKDSFTSLQAQEEELRQNMEELEATQEAMEQKQKLVEEAKVSLEKQNEKLASNEAVLKKAFQKMKTQDIKLRESFDALQTQEEELRQNMEELQTTQEVLAYQKDILEISNRQITKSISYAETIQKAILPSKTLIEEVLPKSFVIYKPKDIVSGDFYWLSHHENKTLVGVIDCTGHGVPGAFMSLVASNILSEVINQKGILQPNLILQELHEGVVKKLNQKEGANNDGMDLTLCLIEKKSNGQTLLTFGGVKQNLYIVRNQELIEIKGNRRSIGGGKRDDERKYTQEEIMLQTQDAVFLATDGYADQANNERRSFSKKKFRELLIEVGDLPAKEQKTILEDRLAKHQQTTEQRDDITVFGFKV
ncbi:PAS domain S-box protein [Bernardetia sp. OM2101]|uniref:PAS domain S-box protein n=1 Tax=Bernardetia sp. OM2101 TaxID=3344876 RepID=UPI0035CF9DE5